MATVCSLLILLKRDFRWGYDDDVEDDDYVDEDNNDDDDDDDDDDGDDLLTVDLAKEGFQVGI